jgi:sporulation protein YlmC with PRC-barrel domain
VVRLSEVLGKEVKKSAEEKVGKIDEVAVDLEVGRIIYVLVTSGGVVGVGDKTLAVPPQLFRIEPSPKTVSVTVDKSRFDDAPRYDHGQWEETAKPDRIAEIYRHYGQEPRFSGMRTNQTRNTSGNGTYVMKATKVIGSPVKNLRDEKVGTMDDLIVDLQAGRIVQVIVSSGGFLGLGDSLSAVPPAAFHYDPAQKDWILDVTKESLAAAPHFKKNQWPNFSDPVYVDSVYRAYRVEPYFGHSAKTAQDQSASEQDVDITRRIRKEILARDGLSLNARNVKIITVNGQVTLRGPVNNDQEKRAIAEIVSRVVPYAKVDNQLEIKAEIRPY